MNKPFTRARIIWLVSRHPGVLEWAEEQNLAFDHHIKHLELGAIGSGDVVIGTLPIPMAASVIARGAQYIHLTLELSEDLRGKELTASQMCKCNARLESFEIYSRSAGVDTDMKI